MLASTAAYDLLYQHLLARISLTEADFTFFCSRLKSRTLSKEQHLLLAGDVCTHMAFVT